MQFSVYHSSMLSNSPSKTTNKNSSVNLVIVIRCVKSQNDHIKGRLTNSPGYNKPMFSNFSVPNPCTV